MQTRQKHFSQDCDALYGIGDITRTRLSFLLLLMLSLLMLHVSYGAKNMQNVTPDGYPW